MSVAFCLSHHFVGGRAHSAEQKHPHICPTRVCAGACRVVFSYTEDQKLIIEGSGAGDMSEVAPRFREKEIQSALLSTEGCTVLITWCGAGLSRMKKAKLPMHKDGMSALVGVSRELATSHRPGAISLRRGGGGRLE